MMGIDQLRQEMASRGLSKTQCESQLVAVVLDILSKSGTAWTNVQEAEKKLAKLENRISTLKQEVSEWENRLHYTQKASDNVEAERKKLYKAQVEYVESFLEALSQCETPEGRDTLKKAQMFVNSVNVDTKYDQTAYIIGLASILSNGECAAIPQLKKINPSLFSTAQTRI